MFTGLIETDALVTAHVLDGVGGSHLEILQPTLAQEIAPGDSIAVNGACLTVTRILGDRFCFEIGTETRKRTNLGRLQPGESVNLERSLRVGDRLGGHFVQGHVDDTGTIESRVSSGKWDMVRFACPTHLTLLMIPQGSIAVDGISLTLVEVGSAGFSVMLIPHTLQKTTLGTKNVGAVVNLEVDMLAKHLHKIIKSQVAP